MKNLKIMLTTFLVGMCLISAQGKADDLSDIRQVAQKFYSLNERTLQCRTTEEDNFDESLIHIPESLFSKELFSFYRVICERNNSDIFIHFGLRTGDPSVHIQKDWKDSISNIRIEKPVLSSKGNFVRITYDLDSASFKQWGNFTELKFVREESKWRIDDIQIGGTGRDRESYTGLVELKSLKKYIKSEIAKWEKSRN